MASSNLPAWPTKGSPCASSSAPGPSPTNSQGASRAPTPSTACRRCLHKPQAVQAAVSRANPAQAQLGKAELFIQPAPGDIREPHFEVDHFLVELACLADQEGEEIRTDALSLPAAGDGQIEQMRLIERVHHHRIADQLVIHPATPALIAGQ